jgi:hypothetical protein
MVKKLYICRECGHVFPNELSEYIENKIQVYCEMCGTPFSLMGVDFKKTSQALPKKPIKPYSTYSGKDKNKSKLSSIILLLNKISYLPLLIFAGIVLGSNLYIIFYPHDWLLNFIKTLIIGFSALIITVYDINHISPKIKEEKYDDIVLDAFCYGILGCIIFGTGTIMLIKGVFILIYVIANPKEEKDKLYHFGLKLKNSINYFSAKAGIVIILLAVFMLIDNPLMFNYVYSGFNFIFQQLASLDLWLQIIIMIAISVGFCLIPIVILSIDLRMRKKIKNKNIFTFGDSVGVFVLGIIGTIVFSMGIFILLKGILLFFLFVGKPFEIEKFESKEIQFSRRIDKELEREEKEEIPPKIIPVEVERKDIQVEVKTEKVPLEEKVTLKEEQFETEEKEAQISKQIITPIEEERTEIKLRLHESLLPVKNEKDKKLVREYFSKIFNVLSKDLRAQIMEINIPKEEKKQLLKELAFLNKQEQEKYIRAVIGLYKELPLKLIKRIRKLPNIKPQYYDKIIEQLKYMDDDEQIEFVHFLEKNA